jgi:hypothetical protein
VVVAIYYLIRKYIVGFLNRVLEIGQSGVVAAG